jgi:hypothetical protein
LLEHTLMPNPDDLPESLRELPFLNAADISTGREFDSQMERIIRFIDRTFAETEARRARELDEVRAEAPPIVDAVQAQSELTPKPIAPPVAAEKRPEKTMTIRARDLLIAVAILVVAGLAFAFSQFRPAAEVAVQTPSPTAAPTAPPTPPPTPQPVPSKPQAPAASQHSDIPIVGSWIQTGTKAGAHPTVYVFVADGTATWHDDTGAHNTGSWSGAGRAYVARWTGAANPTTYEIDPGGQTANEGGVPLKRM